MPNWVRNELTITGDAEQIAKLKAQVSVPLEGSSVTTGEDKPFETPFSFMNIAPPPADKLEIYHGTHGFADGKKQGESEWNWFNFNNREWGVKWDASDAELIHDTVKDLGYVFNTPWGVPVPVIATLSAQYPDLTMNLKFEEEQGWGGELEFEDGSHIVVDEYSEPECHEDFVKRDRDCWGCVDGDQDNMYDDCPDKLEEAEEVEARQDFEVVS